MIISLELRTDRSTHPNYLVLVLDGVSSDQSNALAQATTLRNDGVKIFTIGIGSSVDPSEISSFCTQPGIEDETYVLINDFDDLSAIVTLTASRID